MKKLNMLISAICAAAMLISCVPFAAAAETAESDLTAAVSKITTEYVAANRNNSTKAGLLEAVQKTYSDAALEDADFGIYYSQPMAYDNDTVSGYPLNIPGNDGGVSAKFTINGESVAVACAFEREKEELPATNVAVAGADDGKLVYDSSNNIIGCVEGVDKIVIPAGYNGTMGKPDFTSYPAMNSVKTVIIQNTSKIISEAFKGDNVNWASLKALNIYGGKVTYWQTFDGFFVNACVWGCPALKYLYMPTDTTKNFPKYSFRDLTALETVNVPFGSWYDWGCLYNNGIREYITTGKLASGKWSSASFSDGSLSGGKTVSVIKNTTEITAVRAAAWSVAALNEQSGVESDSDAVANAKTALQKRAWNSGAYDCLGAIGAAFTSEWENESVNRDSRAATITIDTDNVFFATLTKTKAVADEATTAAVREAAAEYVTANGNESSKEGLLAAVQSVKPTATLDDSNYSIYYAQPMAYDNDTVSGYPLNIPGNDGGVAAIFEIGGRTVSIACAFEREKEELPATNVAVAGADDGKLVYDSSNNIIGCVEGVDKIVIPAGYNGTMGKPDFTSYPAMNSVKTVIIQNTSKIISEAFKGDNVNWASLKALNIYGGKVTYWQIFDGFFVNACVWGCPALKYLYMPTDTTKNFPKYSFRDLTALETVNVPFGSWYDWGCLYNNGIREYITTGKLASGKWSSASFSDGSLSGGKTVSVIKNTTEITAVRAAAWSVAALNEQSGVESDSDAVANAKTALQRRAWNKNSYDYFNTVAFSFGNEWDMEAMGKETRTAQIVCGDIVFNGKLERSRIAPIAEMQDDVSVRAAIPAGLRFTAKFAKLDTLAEIGATYIAGIIIAPVDYLNGSEFTAEALNADGKEFLDITQQVWEHTPDEADPYYRMSAVISNIIPGNSGRAFAARAYVDVTYADGITSRYYSDFSSERNAISAYSLALKLLEDAENPVTDPALKAQLEAYVKAAENCAKKTMYINYSASENKFSVVQNYSATENLVAIVKPTGVNKIMNFAPPRFITNTSDSLATDVSLAKERSGAENMSESDWLGPHYTSSGWMGGTHGSDNEGGNPTGFSNNIKLKINGKEVDAAADIGTYAAELEITWDTYAGDSNANPEDIAPKIVEHHTLRFDGATWHVKTDVEFLTDVYWRNYYGMQCVYGVWNSTISYDGGAAKSISDGNARTDCGKSVCDTMLLSKNTDRLEMYLDSGYGLGKRELLGNNSGAFSIAYGSAKNGKAYFSLIKDTNMKAGNTVGFIGSYTFFSTQKIDEEFYNRSVLNEGNAARIASAMVKAQNGEPVTVGVIGGSITEGFNASNRADTSYAGLLKNWWSSSFPESKLTFINAGKGDTDSLMGAYRASEDLLQYNPDFVVVEFSVNDNEDPLFQSTYEGLVRQILSSANKPGVLLLQMMNQNGENRASLHTPIGQYYDLPIISYKEAIWPTGGEKLFGWGELSADTVHPNDLGHSLTAALITHYLEGVKANAASLAGDASALPAALTNEDYVKAVRYNSTNTEPLSLGGFAADAASYQFKNGWTATGSGDKMSIMVENAKHVYVLYYQENGRSGSSATVGVSGGNAATISGDFSGGWNRSVVYEVVNSETENDYTIEITPTSNDGIKFSVLGIFVS